MKSRIIMLCGVLMTAAVVGLSQHPEQQAPPQHPGQPVPRLPAPAGPVGQELVPPYQPGGSPQEHHPQPPDPFAGNLFPPELVMQYRRELGITDEQKAAIREEAIKASTRFSQLQFQMQDEMEAMVALMKGVTIDEQKALAQLDKVLNIEREVKRTQLGLSIRIKNKLTSEQQGKLQELQRNNPVPR
jgi:Spy/CpxP family protein refolding chaperone